LGQKGIILFLEIVDFLFWREQRSCDGRGGAQRPLGRGIEPKKTGARSARARTRGQNPLVLYNCIVLIYVLAEMKLHGLVISKTESSCSVSQFPHSCTYL
jgi:hypothetical protein